MDERTRRTDSEAAPELRRVLPAPPVIKKGSRGRTRSVVGLILLIAIVAGGYWAYRSLYAPQSAGGSGARAQQAPPQSVGAATIGKGDIRVVVNALGTVTPIATVTVQTQISGQLMEVGFTEGQLVKKGDFLAQVDPRPYQLLQAQYEGQLARDQGLLAQAQVDLARYQKLAEQNSIARQQYEDQIYIVQQDQGTVKLDEALVDQQKLNVIYCHIVSPVTGRVGLRLVDPGNYVQTSTSTGLAVITQLQPITVIFPIPEDDLPDIVPQLNAGGTFQVDGVRPRQCQAVGHRPRHRARQSDRHHDRHREGARTVRQHRLRVVPQPVRQCPALGENADDVVTVPTAAIQRGAPGAYVYVINADNTVSVRPIKLGPTDGPMAAVKSGLAAGDRVVIDGTDRLRDGARVIVPGAPAPGDSAPRLRQFGKIGAMAANKPRPGA